MNAIHCIIFSISADITQIQDYISELDCNFPLMCLTPHSLFDYEQKYIKEFFRGVLIFKSFADFISDEEAERCDLEAYTMCSKISQPNLGDYISNIIVGKNRIIADNIQIEFFLKSGAVFSNDLGIDLRVWIKRGFDDNRKVEQSQPDIPKDSRIFKSLKPQLSRVLVQDYSILEYFYILRYNDRSDIFFGNITRVQQYFKKDIIFEKMRISLPTSLFRLMPGFWQHIILKKFNTVIKKENISTIFSSIHEHRTCYQEIAIQLGVEYGLLQDGYIPENYLPYYYLMQCKNPKYYVWDSLSAELFVNNQMRVDISPLYETRELPEITHLPKRINTVLVLTSGAGDWTAVKNRSDDDLMLMTFVEVARKLKDINFIYRCHPLWVHPKHQGERSIDRAITYLRNSGLTNIQISAGSILNSKRYAKDRQLFVDPKSTNNEILSADLVFGEHSISIIDAALSGKIFASVLIAKRRDYFINYSKLGFFHLTSTEDIQQFINEIENNPNIILEKYNQAVRTHNNINNRNNIFV